MSAFRDAATVHVLVERRPLVDTDQAAAAAQVLVKDRSVVETADAETRVVAPAGLQAAIDAEVAKVTSGACCHCRGIFTLLQKESPRGKSCDPDASVPHQRTALL